MTHVHDAYRSEPVGGQVDRAAVLRRLELEVVRRLDGRVAGDYHTADMGPGSERSGARAYEPGDDARRMDWNLTARSFAPHVRTTEADRELETLVLADRSASLDTGTALREKRDVVLGVAAAFGVLTARAGNRFGVVAFGGPEVVRRPPGSGRRAMMASLATLYDTPRYAGPPSADATLGASLRSVPQWQPRRGQVVVVSDFLDGSDWQHALRALALRHQVIAVEVTDPRDRELPDVGMLAVVDPETGRVVHAQTRSSALRERYRAAAEARAEAVRAAVVAAGAEHLRLSTDREWLSDVVLFATGRRDRRRGAAIRSASPMVTR